MGVDYDRFQRPSIYHTATIGDIPFEVIQKALRLLDGEDLISTSLSCRAWRQAAAELIITQMRFDDDQAMARFVCGMQLKSIVFGFEKYSIKKLDLDMPHVGIDYVRVMAQTVAPTLSSLCLRFEEPSAEDVEESDLDCYEVVEAFFSRCLQIRDMRLELFDFGDDPSSLTPSIMDGLRRLKSFDVFDCRGDLLMIAEHAPIQNLSKFSFDHLGGIDAAEESGIISSIAMKCRSLKSISLFAQFKTWESIHKVVECCRDLEEISLYDHSRRLPLKKSEFVAIASLPRLKSLDLNYCLVGDGALSPLAKCKWLRNLLGFNIKLSSDVLRAIGGSLVLLQCRLRLDELEEIVVYCPNLENLNIWIVDEGGLVVGEARLSAAGLIKKGLKKLTKLVINRGTIRLGIDLVG
jgi:hypothetical protein